MSPSTPSATPCLAAPLDAFADAARAGADDDHHFRVEHATLASRQQVQRMAVLGTVAVVQPGFVHHMGSAVGGFALDDATWMPFADLAGVGIRIAASSDHPCAFSEPLLTSARSVTRRTANGTVIGADQSVPYRDWLRAYTAGAAYAGGQAHERGQLATGLRADLVVLDGALDAEHPPSVAETWAAGERVYVASGNSERGR